MLTGCDYVRAQVSQWDDWDVDTMVAISQGESNCSMERVGDTHLTWEQDGREYGYSVGALQVRILPGREHCEASENYWQCAHNIWLGQSYQAWTCYWNGDYLKYL